MLAEERFDNILKILAQRRSVTVQELCDKILSGEIEDSKTIAAVMSYKAKFGQP